jgi:hypothetical protein
VLWLIAGCPATSTGVDAALPPGAFPCGSGTCAEGLICVVRTSNAAALDAWSGDAGDGDAGSPGTCEARPAACGSQGECTLSSCDPACADAVCMAIPGYATVALRVTDGGRMYYCTRSADAS